jgi:hypothetical protein
MTQNIFELAHELAEADGKQEGLPNKKNTILFDSSWIAGVDYKDEKYEEEQDKSVQERDEMNQNEIYETSHHKITSKLNGGENNIDAENIVL